MNITSFDLEKWYVKYEFSSKYNLSASGIKPLKLKDLTFFNEFSEIPITYSPANGNTELINYIAKENNVSDSQVLITNGAIEGIFLIQTLIAQKNKKVICIKPTYPALYNILSDLGTEIIPYDLEFENGYKINFDALKNLIEKENPEALIINFPNNPTGAILSYDEQLELVNIVKKHNILLISDEVYSELTTNNKKLNFSNYYEKSVVINSMSKTYGLAGIRIGWLISTPEIIKECMNIRHYTTLCNNIIGEKIALNILNNKNELINKNLQHLDLNKQITLNILTDLKEKGLIDYIIPEAGLTTFIKINGDTESFCSDFESEESILLLPGNKYGEKYENFLRLGFGIDTDILKYCLDKFYKFSINKLSKLD